MSSILQIILFLLVGFLLGLISRRRPRSGIPHDLADGLTTFVIYISLPALILVRVPLMQFSGGLLVPVLLPWIMLALSATLVLAASRMFRWDDSVQNLLLLLVPLGNTSFLGIPMVQTFFGEQGVGYALLYDQLGSFLALATYGTMVVALHSPTGSTARPEAKEVVARIISFPPFVALLIALAAGDLLLHPSVHSTMEALSLTLVPLVMVAVGLRLRFDIPHNYRLPLAAGLSLKLIVAPLLALLLCRASGLEGEAVDVSIFESGMPPMVAAWALASKAGLHPDLGAAMVGLGILLSFMTLPLLTLFL